MRQTDKKPARLTPADVGREGLHLDLAADALLNGWTRARVIAALVARVQHDTRYLAYRQANQRQTTYDAQVTQDLRALSLAAVWLQEDRWDKSGSGR